MRINIVSLLAALGVLGMLDAPIAWCACEKLAASPAQLCSDDHKVVPSQLRSTWISPNGGTPIELIPGGTATMTFTATASGTSTWTFTHTHTVTDVSGAAPWPPYDCCASCYCTGFGYSGPITIACGNTACGSDGQIYLCNSPGGFNWTGPSGSCSSQTPSCNSSCTVGGPGFFYSDDGAVTRYVQPQTTCGVGMSCSGATSSTTATGTASGTGTFYPSKAPFSISSTVPDLSGNVIQCEGDALYCGGTATGSTVATGTKTATATSSNTASATATASNTGTGQRTDSATYTQTISGYVGPGTDTKTLTITETGTVTASMTGTATVTVTGSTSNTGTASASGTKTGTGTVSGTASWSNTATVTASTTTTKTQTWTGTGTATLFVITGTRTITLTYTRTGSDSMTGTVTATNSATGTTTTTMTGTWYNTGTLTNLTTDATVPLGQNTIIMRVDQGGGLCSGTCTVGHLAEFANSSQIEDGPAYSQTSAANVVVQAGADGFISSTFIPQTTIYSATNASDVAITSYSTTAATVTYSGHPGNVKVWATAMVESTLISAWCFMHIEIDGTEYGAKPDYGASSAAAGQSLILSPIATASGASSGSHTVNLILAASSGNTCTARAGKAYMMVEVGP